MISNLVKSLKMLNRRQLDSDYILMMYLHLHSNPADA